MPAKSRVAPVLHPGLRLAWRGHLLFGPGKAELLEGIARTGSISHAARRMKMSYMKAWLLIQHMEKRIRTPLVRKTRGGTTGGGARLTAAGRALVGSYRAMEADCQRVAQKHLKRIARHIEAK
jgi:molybdate transport system regulatory protein